MGTRRNVRTGGRGNQQESFVAPGDFCPSSRLLSPQKTFVAPRKRLSLQKTFVAAGYVCPSRRLLSPHETVVAPEYFCRPRSSALTRGSRELSSALCKSSRELATALFRSCRQLSPGALASFRGPLRKHLCHLQLMSKLNFETFAPATIAERT